MKPLISLCIPTNGIIEWVIPVLESIYNQEVNDELFEVIIADNGIESQLEKHIVGYRKHNNFFYYKTKCVAFDNCIETYKLAKGNFIKFINHRLCLLPGTLDWFLEFVKAEQMNKPVVYFSNGVLEFSEPVKEYSCFDDFVKTLGIYNTWGTGIGFWHEEIDDICNQKVNELFPDTAVLYHRKIADRYIINDSVFGEEITTECIKKGRYNLFFAFAVEFVQLLRHLFDNGDISEGTLDSITNELERFIIGLYFRFIIKQEPCSYDLSDYEIHIEKYFNAKEIHKKALKKYTENFYLENIVQIYNRANWLLNCIKNRSMGKKIYIYGAGNGGKIVCKMLMDNNIIVSGFIDRKAKCIEKCMGIDVRCINEVYVGNIFIIISLLAGADSAEEKILTYNFSQDDVIRFFDELREPMRFPETGSSQ